MQTLALALGLAALAPPPAPTSSPTAATAAELRDRALSSSTAWDVLTSLTTDVGPRPTGSAAMVRAKDWAVRTLTTLGFKNVHTESFVKPNAWQRGAESFAMTAPYAMALHGIGLGNSAPGVVEAEVVAFPSLEALNAAPAKSLAGKIALVDQAMTRTQSGEGYGAAVRARGAGPGIAASKGAVAFLLRSVATGEGRAPHTGATAPGVAIPSAALGIADADLLARLCAKGPVKVAVNMASTTIPEAAAWNISGEIPGSGDEVIVVGGHLDSWDPGEGAVDDGAGVSVTVGAAKVIGEYTAQHHVKPKRTIRVVLFGSEETGGSSDAYEKAHTSELAKIAMTAESDTGAGRILKVQLPANAASDPALAGLATVLAPLDVFIANDPPKYGGSDIEGLMKAGVPVVDFNVDVTHYFDVHHSADDTLDKVDRRDLAEQVAAWSALLWFVADTGVDLRHPPAPPPESK